MSGLIDIRRRDGSIVPVASVYGAWRILFPEFHSIALQRKDNDLRKCPIDSPVGRDCLNAMMLAYNLVNTMRDAVPPKPVVLGTMLRQVWHTCQVFYYG